MGKYRLVAALLVGIVLGIAIYTFIYAKGYSYASDDPDACINCHIMNDQYNAWMRSSHRNVAVCNDCHTPPSLVGKYTTKALNGFWHSWYFTTGNFPENIHITERNRNVTEQACRKCHSELVQSLDAVHSNTGTASCLQCHFSVGHLQ